MTHSKSKTKRYFRTRYGLHSFADAYGWLTQPTPDRERLLALLLVVFGEAGSRPPGEWVDLPEGTEER